MQKAKTVIFGVIFFIILMLCLYSLFFSNMDSSKYFDLITLEKSKFGGTVYNNTDHDIKVTDWRIISILPPHKSSKDIGIFDADGLIIDRPTLFENKKYSDGLIKLCDISSIKVVKKDGYNEFVPSFTYKICKLYRDSEWHKSLKEAFPIGIRIKD